MVMYWLVFLPLVQYIVLFNPRLGQTKDLKWYLHTPPCKHAAFRSKSKDFIAHCQDNVSKWFD